MRDDNSIDFVMNDNEKLDAARMRFAVQYKADTIRADEHNEEITADGTRRLILDLVL